MRKMNIADFLSAEKEDYIYYTNTDIQGSIVSINYQGESIVFIDEHEKEYCCHYSLLSVDWDSDEDYYEDNEDNQYDNDEIDIDNRETIKITAITQYETGTLSYQESNNNVKSDLQTALILGLLS